MMCQGKLDKGPAIVPKYAPLFSAASMEPVKAPTANRIIHPTTTVYPIAIPKDPITGIQPI